MTKELHNRFKNQLTIDIVAENVRQYRTLLNLTQAELDGRCDIDTRQIQRIEYGHTDTKLSVLKSLADALEISMADLVSKS